ncbi:MAG TPA: protein kinase [Blastocatellia bacterium]|nr:protein kinase [Blastocatellia bacterium]
MVATGTKLGPYEIVSQLGAGGMGEVYRARDTRLNRMVAIKVLPEHLASNSETKQRFEREALAVSSLNHPHICTLHDIGHQDGIDYLVMELIEGESLAERLKKGPIPTHQVLDYAMQIADALDKAHRAGIAHRDLKPGNIMLTRTGAKLLDFGLAKRVPVATGKAFNGFSELPTEVEKLTGEGTIIGTLQYMSPEQLEGLESDSRTDIFALGTVVYEMATGRRAFTGRSQVSLMGAILNSNPPPISSLQPLAPATLDRIVHTCLAKDPEDRWQSAHDVWLELKWIAEGVAEAPPSTAAPSRSRSQLFTGSVLWFVVGLLAASVVFWLLIGRSNGKSTGLIKPSRLTIKLPDNTPVALTGFVPLAVGRLALALSPDGSNLVYTANHNSTAKLFLRPLNAFDTKPISGTEGAYNPFFSPDGNWVAFFADNKLKKVALSGGEPITLCEARNPIGATWGEDDTIFFGNQEGGVLSQIPAQGGSLGILPVRDQVTDVTTLPDKRWLLYSTNPSSNPDFGQIKAISLDTGEIKVIIDGGRSAHYIPTGHLVFSRAASLMSVAFDITNQKVVGQPVTLVEGIRGEAYGTPQVALSLNGTAAYIPGVAGWIGKPVWVDMQGNVTPTEMPPQCYSSFQLSRDGKRVAIGVGNAKDDIWISDVERRTFLRLTVDGHNTGPVWSPDGKRIAFASTRGGHFGIYSKASDGSGSEDNLTTSENNQAPESWSPDGKMISFVEWKPDDAGDIWVLNLEGDKKAHLFHQTRFSEFFSAFSPNGNWMAYTSDESGRYEVYVRPFPGPGGQWQISTEGGEEPVWAPNGEALFYRNGQKWMIAEVNTKSDFIAKPPRLLFESYFINIQGLSHFVGPDGKRQLMIKPPDQDPSPKNINVILNLLDELKYEQKEKKQ